MTPGAEAWLEESRRDPRRSGYGRVLTAPPGRRSVSTISDPCAPSPQEIRGYAAAHRVNRTQARRAVREQNQQRLVMLGRRIAERWDAPDAYYVALAVIDSFRPGAANEPPMST